MDIPITFKFFDKLKLYQDYLKEDSMLERTKDTYWLCEKSILFWGYSEDHQHLGVPLSTVTFDNKSTIVSGIAEKIGVYNCGSIGWVKDKITDKITVEHILENLITLEFANILPYPNISVKLNLRGFLLGELLFETYEKPGFWSRNFRKYKLALLAFYTTFLILFLTVYLVFVEQIGLIKSELIGVSIGNFLGYSWWSTVTTCFLIYLGLKQVWKKL